MSQRSSEKVVILFNPVDDVLRGMTRCTVLLQNPVQYPVLLIEIPHQAEIAKSLIQDVSHVAGLSRCDDFGTR
jgi:hypothetical protein